MSSELSDFIDRLKYFGKRPKDETKVLAGILREDNLATMVLVLMLREGSAEFFQVFWIKREGVYDRGLFQIEPSSPKMETFEGGNITAALQGQNFNPMELYARPIAFSLSERLVDPSSAETLVKAFKDQDQDLLYRLNKAGVPVFKSVLRNKKVLEESVFPVPIDLIGRSI